jgi:arylsulfatase A-like enzyme
MAAAESDRSASITQRRFETPRGARFCYGMRRILLFSLLASLAVAAAGPGAKPNIVFILADDLGYGELGCYGEKLISTPNIDRLAAEGMKFTQFYAGSTVCAPSRSVLMTGQHMGHTRVRGNAGRVNTAAQMLRADDVTVARVLRDAGYATGLAGKWGLGLDNDEGEPRKQGFDYYFGFLSQTHAHNHFPDFLWRNGEKVTLPNDRVPAGEVEGTGYATKRVTYANDLFFEEANAFITRNRERPFFFFLALTTPHANNERGRLLGDGNEVPDNSAYADRPWNESQKNHAAMITRMDRGVGDVMAKLKELGLDERTIVIFASDNGPHREAGPNYDPKFFDASGPLRGIKRDLWDGGIRVPFIARWPGRIKAGTTSKYVGYFGDLMATFAEFAGAKPPPHLDSLSLVRTLTGRWWQPKHDYLYWEFYEGGTSQAVLLGDRWKAVRLKTTTAPVLLYDLRADLGEKADVATQNPKVVQRATDIMREAHVDNEHWKIPAASP